jgi:hypothetical protein
MFTKSIIGHSPKAALANTLLLDVVVVRVGALWR